MRVGADSPGAWPSGLDPHAVEIGRKLYESLGPEAQSALIRTFANLDPDDGPRVLLLQFSSPNAHRGESGLALEDLPWELLHDGETFISWRYGLQIVRSHARDTNLHPRTLRIRSWDILLITPFVFVDAQRCQAAGLEPLDAARDEVKALRRLQSHTRGLVRIQPSGMKGGGGVTTFAALERALRTSTRRPSQIIHYVGHGMAFQDEPCLCFEAEDGGVDYVSISRMRRLLQSIREEQGPQAIPSVLFLNACSSSSRGRYSAGFASGLHDLGLSVIGYQSEIRDDDRPQLAAEHFYRSLCVDQSLQSPHRPPNLVTAVEAARRSLRGQEIDAAPVWGRLRAYIPASVHFYVEGRGFLERTTQRLYARFAQWMTPSDYTDHLSAGFMLAILFGVIMGIQNLAFILPEGVWLRHLTYSEIVSELIRIFLVGPLSFLGAAILMAWQTHGNHRFMLEREEGGGFFGWIGYLPRTMASCLLAGGVFALLFHYSFSRLDLLTSQTHELALLIPIRVETLWYALVGTLGGTLALSAIFASVFNVARRETLHSYRTYYLLTGLLLVYATLIAASLYIVTEERMVRKIGWLVGALALIFAYAALVAKFVKEAAWRAAKKRRGAAFFSLRKFIPLIGGVAFLIAGYFFLEETVRFEQGAIQQAISARIESPPNETPPRVAAVLERALRQRAIQRAPDGLQQAAREDWLLSIIYADLALLEAQREDDLDERMARLREARSLLEIAQELNPEARFMDYTANIEAMLNVVLAGIESDAERKRQLYEIAIDRAKWAVMKDDRNFAYLDTLARAEAALGTQLGDLEMLKSAQTHTHKAKWSAFFLRSPRAAEVNEGIEILELRIKRAIDDLLDENDES